MRYITYHDIGVINCYPFCQPLSKNNITQRKYVNYKESQSTIFRKIKFNWSEQNIKLLPTLYEISECYVYHVTILKSQWKLTYIMCLWYTCDNMIRI